MSSMGAAAPIETTIPARMDRLPWSRWHLRIIIALGTSWILDGLEVTLVGSLGGILQSKDGLGLSPQAITAAASTYLLGAVMGALLFGHLTDRYGRRRLFLVTLATYSLATLSTGFTTNLLTFSICRFLTGLGIGGEYAAINSAIDELIPAKIRGTIDLLINATYWAGASLGSGVAVLLLGSHTVPMHLGWRLAFAVGGVLGLGVLILRLGVPESPRWLMLRGKEEEAARVVHEIESDVSASVGKLPAPEGEPLKIQPRDHTPLGEIFRNMLGENRKRSILGLILMVAQAFFFNAVFFTFGLIGKQFFGIADAKVPLQLLPFALASLLGPVLLGPLFDRIGRKPMITLTYGISGLLLAATGYMFADGIIALRGLQVCSAIIFFVASSAASAAYLTVSEIFPLEIRAFAIAIFYAIGTLIGGVAAPLFFGMLIQTGSKTNVALGYELSALLMLIGAVTEVFIGVEAARRSLESITQPLQARR